MMEKEDKAIASFRAGLNCAQAVVTAYADELNADSEMALSISAGFGGGMGRLQGTCGAVTGSYMVLGLFNATQHTGNHQLKEETYSMIRRFSEQFKAIHGTTDCRKLLNCDLLTSEGQEYLKVNNLTEHICEKCIADSIRIIERLTGKDG